MKVEWCVVTERLGGGAGRRVVEKGIQRNGASRRRGRCWETDMA